MPDGQRLVVRGVENIFGRGLSERGELIPEIAKTGANAIRLLPNISPNQLTLPEIEALIVKSIDNGMVVFLNPYPGDVAYESDWFAQPEVKAMIDRYSAYIILDVLQEGYQKSDEEWRDEAIDAVKMMRELGYRQPLTLLSRDAGRNGPTILKYASEVLETDPEQNLIFGVQMYWTNDYINGYGMTIAQACERYARQPYPIQVGINANVAEFWAGSNDYRAVINECGSRQIGWLYWDWFNPFGSIDSLSEDGQFGHWRTNLEHPFGGDFGEFIADAIQATSVRVIEPRQQLGEIEPR
jgi:hypothetical protein